jgi:hypothetical protein
MQINTQQMMELHENELEERCKKIKETKGEETSPTNERYV